MALESRRTPWEDSWSEVIDYCNPSRAIYIPDDETKPRTRKTLYSSRASLALKKASAGFQGYTASRRSEWLGLLLSDAELSQEPGVADWLEECVRAMVSVFATSGYYQFLGEMCMDGWSVGTASGYIEEGKDGRIIYRALHPKAVWFAEDAYGDVTTIMEDVWLPLKAVIQLFGEESLSDARKAEAQSSPMKGTLVRHAVLPMEDRFKELAKEPMSGKMPFASLWWLDGESSFLSVGGYWENPYVVWRHSKNPGDWYGGSPAHDCLGEVLGANQMARSRIKLGNLISDPPLLLDEELEGQDDIIPGNHIYRTRADSKIEPIQIGANYPIARDNEERTDQIIDEHFMVPVFQMLQAAESRVKTYGEVIEMVGEKVATLGSATDRWETEVLAPSIKRTFNILMRQGKLPPPPESFIEARKSGAVVKIEFLGLLAQMQRRYYQTSGLNPAIGMIQAIGQMSPEAIDNVDFDALIRQGLESVGVSQAIIREKPDVDELRQQRAAQQQQMQQQQIALAQTQMLTQNADKLGKKPEPGSPMTQIGAAMSGAGA